MVSKNYVPERGDVVWIDFDPQSGHEQKGKRPALVISRKAYNEKVGLAVLCPITSKVKGFPFEVAVSKKNVKGVILSDQVKNLDWRARNATFADTVDKSIVTDVQANLQLLLF